jgi:hypothetical protein
MIDALTSIDFTLMHVVSRQLEQGTCATGILIAVVNELSGVVFHVMSGFVLCFDLMTHYPEAEPLGSAKIRLGICTNGHVGS